MRTYAQKQNQPQRRASFNLTGSKTPASGETHHAHPILYLQRTIGNQSVLPLAQANTEALEVESRPTATARFAHDFSQVPVYAKVPVKTQTKLTVHTPGDVYEQEADRVADHVMRMPDPQLQRVCACGGRCPKCQAEQRDQEHKVLQTERVGEGDAEATGAPPIVHDVVGSAGCPLDSDTRKFMESRFAHDFSHVRVHTDARAAESAESVLASVYTVGHDMVFGEGQYAPGTTEGRRLLAHELTHVLQQGGVSRLELGLQLDPGRNIGRTSNATALSQTDTGHLQRKPDVGFTVFPIRPEPGGKLEDPDQTLIPGTVGWPVNPAGRAPLDADARVRVTGDAGDDCRFTLGFAQTVYSHKLEFDYEGRRRGDGSTRVEFVVDPAPPIRDGEPGEFWYELSGNRNNTACGGEVEPHIGDYPTINNMSKVRVNTLTGQSNFLRLVKRVIGFVTTLVAHSTATGVQPLRFFTWTYQMGISFTPDYDNPNTVWPFTWHTNSTTLGDVHVGQHPTVPLFTTATATYNNSLNEEVTETT